MHAENLYSQLESSNRQARRMVAGQLIRAMSLPKPDTKANAAYRQLCNDTLSAFGLKSGSITDSKSGIFSADESASFLDDQVRVKGYLDAIGRTRNVGTAIDAGCGSSALLAVATAIAHPKAAVFAYEIDEKSAQCATRVVELLGLNDQVEVVHADVTTASLPAADLAVTETFYKGLRQEMGHHITPILARCATEVLPSTAIFFASDTYPHTTPSWRQSAVIDLTIPSTSITGRIHSTDSGDRPISIYTGFYDTRGEAILGQPGERIDSITAPIWLGDIATTAAGVTICYSYALSPIALDKPKLWTE